MTHEPDRTRKTGIFIYIRMSFPVMTSVPRPGIREILFSTEWFVLGEFIRNRSVSCGMTHVTFPILKSCPFILKMTIGWVFQSNSCDMSRKFANMGYWWRYWWRYWWQETEVDFKYLNIKLLYYKSISKLPNLKAIFEFLPSWIHLTECL